MVYTAIAWQKSWKDMIVYNHKAFEIILVGEPKSRIVQKRTFFAPERYTAGILYTDSLNSAWYETTV